MKTLTTLMLTIFLAALVMPAPSDAAQGRRSSGDKGAGKQQEKSAGKQTGKSASRGPSFTPGMWAAAAGLYAKKTKDLPKKTGSNAAPRPQLGATTGGRGTTASATGNVMIAVPNARNSSNWSMTATRGRRNSTESRRSVSSGTSSSTTLGSLPN